MEMQELLIVRGKTHGDFAHHATITQELKDTITSFGDGIFWDKLDYCQRESIHMIVHKIGRILAGDPNFKDHWDDIGGYAKLVADRCAK